MNLRVHIRGVAQLSAVNYKMSSIGRQLAAWNPVALASFSSDGIRVDAK